MKKKFIKSNRLANLYYIIIIIIISKTLMIKERFGLCRNILFGLPLNRLLGQTRLLKRLD